MSLGKKILSAFIEVDDDNNSSTEKTDDVQSDSSLQSSYTSYTGNTQKFKEYFDKLFSEANIPGPDYFEFSKMIEAMNVIPDEKARYSAAFAGLTVQGLDKQKLLSTAQQYLDILNADADKFNETIRTALEEKVIDKKKEIEESAKRIQQLSQEITDINNRVTLLNGQIKENEEKIKASSAGYLAELGNMKSKIESDLQKIKQHIA